MIEDAELLSRYAEDRSEDAFAELVRRRISLVYSVALRQTRDAQRAEDVAQSVFTDLARKAATLSRRPVLVGWLYRSAQFAATDVVRAEQSRARREKGGPNHARYPGAPVLLVLAVGTASYEHQSRRATDASLAGAKENQAVLAARLNAMEESKPRRSDAGGPSPSLASTVGVTLPTLASAMKAEQIRQLEGRGKREASLAVVADIYGAFLRQARLDQDTADAFLNFTCDERLAALAAALAARAKGIRWMDDPEAKEQVMRGATSRDADIRRLLGNEWHSKFEEFRATSNIRTTINQISDRLDDANALTDDQIMQLARRFSELQKLGKAARAPADAVLQLIGMPLADPMVEAARSVRRVFQSMTSKAG